MQTKYDKSELKSHFKRISEISNIKLKVLGIDNISKNELYDIVNFKLKLVELKLKDFNDEDLINKLITLGERIIKK